MIFARSQPSPHSRNVFRAARTHPLCELHAGPGVEEPHERDQPGPLLVASRQLAGLGRAVDLAALEERLAEHGGAGREADPPSLLGSLDRGLGVRDRGLDAAPAEVEEGAGMAGRGRLHARAARLRELPGLRARHVGPLEVVAVVVGVGREEEGPEGHRVVLVHAGGRRPRASDAELLERAALVGALGRGVGEQRPAGRGLVDLGRGDQRLEPRQRLGADLEVVVEADRAHRLEVAGHLAADPLDLVEAALVGGGRLDHAPLHRHASCPGRAGRRRAPPARGAGRSLRSSARQPRAARPRSRRARA